MSKCMGVLTGDTAINCPSRPQDPTPLPRIFSMLGQGLLYSALRFLAELWKAGVGSTIKDKKRTGTRWRQGVWGDEGHRGSGEVAGEGSNCWRGGYMLKKEWLAWPPQNIPLTAHTTVTHTSIFLMGWPCASTATTTCRPDQSSTEEHSSLIRVSEIPHSAHWKYSPSFYC